MDYPKLTNQIVNNASDSWKEEYEEVPSKECKAYNALSTISAYMHWQEYFATYEDYQMECKRLLEKLTLADWEYLYKYCGNNPWRTRCKKRIAELKGESV